MEWMKNIQVNLQAKGPAAVMIAFIGAVTALGLFGEGDLAGYALGIMSAAFGMFGVSLTQKM